MQKVSMILVAAGILCSLFFVKADALSNNTDVKKEQPASGSYAQKISSLYQRIDFGEEKPLAPEVFDQACRGYFNLKAAGRTHSARDILTVCDFSLSANTKRLWVIDLSAGKVLYHSLVAHGQGTGEEFALHFSNREGSHQSSLGFYITEDTYTGNNGYSLRLEGMDHDYNDRAYDRAIVMHGADYVCSGFINNHKRLGRSWGCPAVPVALAQPIINAIRGGTCLYIYYPDNHYLASSKWLNGSPGSQDTGFLVRSMPAEDSSKPGPGRSKMLADASLLGHPAELQVPQPAADSRQPTYQGVHLETGSSVE